MAYPARSIRIRDLENQLRRRRLAITDMVELYGVSERTIRRDLSDLQAAPLRLPIRCEQLWWIDRHEEPDSDS